MNARANPEIFEDLTDLVSPTKTEKTLPSRDSPRVSWRRRARPFLLWRTRIRSLSLARLLRGGRLNDSGRLPRYLLLLLLAVGAVWAPIAAYLTFAPVRYGSTVSMILPGAGSNTSVNLSDIGQASTSSNSAYSSSAISPTVTYQNLLQSALVIEQAAGSLGIPASTLGRPRVKLRDQTSLMLLEMTGASPEEARDRVEAILNAFLIELKALREDEIARRETSVTETVEQYQQAVDAIRAEIAALQSRSGLTSDEQYGQIVASNEILRSRIAEARVALEETETSISSLSSMLAIVPENAALAMRLHADLEYRSLADNAAREAAVVAELARDYGPNHPKRVEAENRYVGARTRLVQRGELLVGKALLVLEEEIDTTADSKRTEMLSELVALVVKRDALQGQLDTLGSQFREGERRVRSLVSVSSELDRLNRDHKVAEAVFASALARVNTSKTDIFASYPMVQIAAPASLSWTPVSPKRTIALVGGIAATFFLIGGLTLAWIRRPLIDRLLSRRDEPEAGDRA